jgi:hypothetical protein
MREMTPDQLDNWHARARAVAARLAQLGIPARVEVKYEGGECVELQFLPSPLATIALMELLAAGITNDLTAGDQNGELN